MGRVDMKDIPLATPEVVDDGDFEPDLDELKDQISRAIKGLPLEEKYRINRSEYRKKAISNIVLAEA